MDNPIILAIETSGAACSAALLVGANLYYRFEQTQREHTRLILPMVESLLLEASISLQEINAIAVGRGPGSFTGVRIAVSVAQGLGFALQCPIYPISTLTALAFQAGNDQPEEIVVIPAIDARIQEIYAAVYQVKQSEISCLQAEHICAENELFALCDLSNKKIVAIGSGWDLKYPQKGMSGVQLLSQRYPDAKHIGLIAKKQWQQGILGMSAKNVLPVYLRDQVAQKSEITF